MLRIEGDPGGSDGGGSGDRMRITRRWMGAISAVVAVASVFGGAGAASALTGSQYPSTNVGIDISYPSCHTKIPSGEPFGVVGVSGGRVYSDNACAAAEAAHFTNVSLYVNTGLYTGGTYYSQAQQQCVGSTDPTCAAFTYGYLAGKHAVTYARSQGLGLTATTWWLDVETTNTWDAQALNVRSIQGEYQGVADALNNNGSTIGVYAVPSQWNQIVGVGSPLTTSNWPVWYATGASSMTSQAASQYCASSYSFTGGTVQLVQWAPKIDQDYAC